MPLPQDWRQFIESLNSSGVEYLVVGAVALAHHGFPRYTGDLDVLVRNSTENSKRLESALTEFGLAALGLKAADFLNSYQVTTRHRSWTLKSLKLKSESPYCLAAMLLTFLTNV